MGGKGHARAIDFERSDVMIFVKITLAFLTWTGEEAKQSCTLSWWHRFGCTEARRVPFCLLVPASHSPPALAKFLSAIKRSSHEKPSH